MMTAPLSCCEFAKLRASVSRVSPGPPQIRKWQKSTCSAPRQFAGTKNVVEGEILLVGRQHLVAEAVGAELDVRQPGARHQLDQLRGQALRAQEAAPGQLHVAPQEGFADFRDVAGGGVEDRIHDEDVLGAQPLELRELLGHQLGRPAAVPPPLDQRVGAIAAAEAAAALGLHVEHPAGPQVVRGNRLRPVGIGVLAIEWSGRGRVDNDLSVLPEDQARNAA